MYYVGYHHECDYGVDMHKTRIAIEQSSDLAQARIFADKLGAELEAKVALVEYQDHRIESFLDSEIEEARRKRFKRELQGI